MARYGRSYDKNLRNFYIDVIRHIRTHCSSTANEICRKKGGMERQIFRLPWQYYYACVDPSMAVFVQPPR